MTFPKKMPHLVGALKLPAPPNQKMCVHLVAGFVLDTPGAEFVCGTFRAADEVEAATLAFASPVPFIHAWAEYKGAVWSPTAMDQMGGQLAPMNRDGYYAVNGVTDVKRLPRPALLKVAREIGLSRHLRLGVPTKGGVSVGQSILDAAGKPFRLDGFALLPMETER